jgi:hypothetical protein
MDGFPVIREIGWVLLCLLIVAIAMVLWYEILHYLLAP